jgi:hypothetical protein
VARSIRVIKNSELKSNGGKYALASGPAIPVSIAEEWQHNENDIQGGASMPIYIVGPTDEDYPRLTGPVTEVVRLTSFPREVGRRVARPVYLVPESPAYGTIDSIDWEYRDDFLDTHAAGTLENTLASDGINPRTSILDPLDGFATNGSELVISEGGVSSYPTFIDAYVGNMYEVSYEPGIILVVRVNTESGNNVRIGFWPNDICGNTYAPAIILAGSALYMAYSNSSRLIDNNTIQLGTYYDFAFVTSSTGFKIYWKDSSSATWNIGISTSLHTYAASRMVFGIESITIGATPARVKFCRIPLDRHIIPPYMSDSFTIPMVSDGLGHPEAAVLGAGGGGIAWETDPPEVSGTPVEAVTNGDLELWDDANTATGWTTFTQSGGTITQETVEIHGGSNAVRIYGGGDTAKASISQINAEYPRVWHYTQFWAKSPTTGALLAVPGSTSIPITSEWAMYRGFELATSTTGPQVLTSYYGPTDQIAYVDDISFHTADVSKMFQVRDMGISTGINAYIELVDGNSFGGAVFNLDDPENPQNYVVIYKNPGASWILAKVVSGTPTRISTAGTADSVGFVKKIGNVFTLYDSTAYPNASAKTISDASIASNTYFGRLDPLGQLSKLAFYRNTDNTVLNNYVVG